MNIHFRQATTADLSLIFSLANKIWREHYPAIIGEEQVEYMLNTRYNETTLATSMDNGEQFYLAFDDEQPIAYASIQHNSDDYYLHKFYVDVALHRSGVGKIFFNYLLQQLSPLPTLRLQVNRQNIKAINFYFKFGFIIESVGDFDIGGGYFMNDFVMVRK
jgi:GNAT superfamily N-acetyltransferase